MAIEFSNDNNFELLSMPIHPFAKVSDQKISDDKRYTDFLDRMQWPLRRLLISGIHVHVGVESGEKAIAIINGMKRYIPYFIALSANSPFFEGQNTGLASTRTKIFEGLPNTGIPERLRNYSEFQKFMRTLIKSKSIDSIREIWWDIRPHPGFGTVEIRICDSIPNLMDIKDLTAFCQALVVGLSRHYDNATQLPYLDNWILYENKWRATRYGIDADLIMDEDGKQVSIRSEIINTIKNLSDIVNELNLGESMDRLINRVKKGHAFYKDQISIFNKRKDLKDVIIKDIGVLKNDK
tara:strand:+ start:664 stop:1548 length:885 start_codon:yes stop_codon:yes gene_type:complete